MFDSFPSYIEINLSFIIILTVSFVAGIISYYLYRRTIPPISKKWRVYLGINRGLVIAAIFLVLFAPEITVVWNESIKKSIAIAVDKSASMGLRDKNVRRIEQANSIMQRIAHELNGFAKLSIYEFDVNTIKTTRPAIETSDLSTDINGALKKIISEDKYTESVIIISDGNITSGDNPLFSNAIKRTKIFTIGIGDTNEIPDLIITDVKTNKIVYRNKPTKIQANIMALDLDQRTVSLTLKESQKIIAVKRLTLTSAGTTIPITFEIVPDKMGILQYRFELENHPEEQIVENNKYNFNLEVLKDKINIGLIASKPVYDVKFMRQILNNIEEINLNIAVEKRGNQTYFSNISHVLDSIDVLILHDFPSTNTTVSLRNNVRSVIKKNNIPLLFCIGQAVTATQLSFVQDFFPILSLRNSPNSIKTQVDRTTKGQFTSIFEIFDNKDENNRFWEKCPPIQYPFANPIFNNDCDVLLAANNPQNKFPILLSYHGQGDKSMLLLGSGFWRWHFLLAEDRQFSDGWKTILYNLIRWLDTGGVNKNVILSTNQKDFQIGETIQLQTQVFDGSFIPIDDGLVQVKIAGPSGSFETQSENIGDGIYSGKFTPLMKGKYNIESTAWKNDILIGNDKIEIIAMPVNNEFLYNRQDNLFLQKLAEKSGGKYFSDNNYYNLFKYLDLSPEIKKESKTIELWHQMSILILIIVLLSIEWFIRKRKGLA